MTSSTLLPNGTYIAILVSIKRQFEAVFIEIENDWKKLHSFRHWQPKTWTWQIWRVIFRGGGHLLRKTVRHSSLSNLVIIFIWIDKGHVVIDSVKIIWIFAMANSRNVDLTGKQHLRHQQFWRYLPGSIISRSRDNLFSHYVKGQSTSRNCYVIFNIL